MDYHHNNLFKIWFVFLFTSKVSDPPTMLRPKPTLSLLISIVDSTPGFIGAVAGSGGGSTEWSKQIGDKDSKDYNDIIIIRKLFLNICLWILK